VSPATNKQTSIYLKGILNIFAVHTRYGLPIQDACP